MIKKILLAVTATVTSTVSFASTGLYVQGDVLVSKLEAKESSTKFKKNIGAPRIAIGKDTGNIRYQADYTYLGQLKNTVADSNFTHDAKLQAHSAGVSAIYDVDTKTALTPYVGVRAGINVLDLDVKQTSTNLNASSEQRKTQLGVGILGGAQYNINSKFAVNAGLEYNYLGKLDNVEGTKVDQYGANIGARYNF